MDLKIMTNYIFTATLSEPGTRFNKPRICFLKERGWLWITTFDLNTMDINLNANCHIVEDSI